jgi:hypothetical protein
MHMQGYVFPDAVNISDYTASNRITIDVESVRKSLVGSSSGPMKVLPQYLHVGTEENYEILIQNNRCSDRDSNRDFPNMGRTVNLMVVSLLGPSWRCPSKSSHTYKQIYTYIHTYLLGHAVAYLVEALCYKPEGRSFDSRWGFFFQFS